MRDFPKFDSLNANNEFGKVGSKAIVESIDETSPFWREVDKSREF